jgi:hypothetical protein
MKKVAKARPSKGKSRPITFRIKETDYLLYEKVCKMSKLSLSDIPRTAILDRLTWDKVLLEMDIN